jgi:hypothetical protein
MARPVFYQIVERSDGLFTVIVELSPDHRFSREGLKTLAEVESAVETLRHVAAICGAPLHHAPIPVVSPQRPWQDA